MSDGTKEARVAAMWWASRLAHQDDDVRTGDAMNEAFAMHVRSKMPKPTPEQIEAFQAYLERALLERVNDPEDRFCWRAAVESGEHRRGSAFRTFGVDYGPDPILADALTAAGIPDHAQRLALPLKTVMWFNPGHVTVSLGYNAAERKLTIDDR